MYIKFYILRSFKKCKISLNKMTTKDAMKSVLLKADKIFSQNSNFFSSYIYLLTIFVCDTTCFFTPVTPKSFTIFLHTTNPKHIFCKRFKVLNSE